MVGNLSHISKTLGAAVVALGLAQGAFANDVEFPVETDAMVAATDALFQLLEQQQAPKSNTSGLQIVPAGFTKTSDEVAGFEGETLSHLTGYRITWYPMDRLMGSVDFMGTWDGNANLVCGYVSWDMTDPTNPDLMQVNATYLTPEDLTGPADAVHATLLDANCAFGSIDENYAFFDVES